MGLKEAGLRGSLRSVSTGVPAIPGSVVEHMEVYWPMDEGSGGETLDTLSGNDRQIDLQNGAGWTTTDFFTEVATTYDGVDDRFVATDDIYNAQDVSLGGWFRFFSADDFGRIFLTQPPTQSVPDNGIRVSFSGSGTDEFRYAHFNGGTQDDIDYNNPMSFDGSWFFITVSASGDDADVRIWDRTTQIFNESVSLSRGITNEQLTAMYTTSQPTEGDVAAYMANTSSAVAESQWADIWEDTR